MKGPAGVFLFERHMQTARLTRDFFDRDTVVVARDLLGRTLVRRFPDGTVARLHIVETEAYTPDGDTANHASRGPTPRTAPMFGPPGHAYVYMIYGKYHCFNIVTEGVGQGAAVLIRAAEPLEGVEILERHRPVRRRYDLTNGPGKLCIALNIDRSFTGHDCITSRHLWFEEGAPIPDDHVARTPRIGIDYAAEHDRLALKRMFIKSNPWVSK